MAGAAVETGKPQTSEVREHAPEVGVAVTPSALSESAVLGDFRSDFIAGRSAQSTATETSTQRAAALSPVVESGPAGSSPAGVGAGSPAGAPPGSSAVVVPSQVRTDSRLAQAINGIWDRASAVTDTLADFASRPFHVAGVVLRPFGFVASLGAQVFAGALDGFVGRFAMKASGAYREAMEFLAGRKEDAITRGLLDGLASNDEAKINTAINGVERVDSELFKRMRDLANAGRLNDARDLWLNRVTP